MTIESAASNFDDLLLELQQGSPGQRYEAMLKIKYAIEADITLIERLLSHASQEICETGVWIISQLQKAPYEVIPNLIALLDIDSLSLREKVLLALKRFDSDEAQQAIKKYSQIALFCS